MNRLEKLYLVFIFALSIQCTSSAPAEDIHSGKTNYERVANWPQLPKGFILGNPTGLGINSHGNLIVFHRANRKWPLLGNMPTGLIESETIITLDSKTGHLLNACGANLFIMPHGLTVDDKDNIWVTDVGLHQIFKFDSKGRLVMKLGEARVAGNDSKHFNQPTDVAIAKDGSFYVSDGYGNSRIMKFSATGKFILQWGKKGSENGNFNIPHAISLDDKEHVYVADRENSSVQVFEGTGKFIKKLTQENFGKITSVYFDQLHHNLVAVDDHTSWFGLKHNGSDIILFDILGRVKHKFAKKELAAEKLKAWYHDVVMDNEGNIYVGDILGNTLQKFKKSSN